MTLEDPELRDALEKLSHQVRPAPGLADLVLRASRRRRHATRTAVACGTALAVAGTVGVVSAIPKGTHPSSPIGGPSKPVLRTEKPVKPSPKIADKPYPQPNWPATIAAPSQLSAVMLQWAVGSEQVDHRWYISTGTELVRTDWFDVSASPDGRRFAVREDTKDSLPRRIGLLSRGSMQPTWVRVNGTVGEVAWSPDGRWVLAAGEYGGVDQTDSFVIDPRKGTVIATIDGNEGVVRWTGDSHLAVREFGSTKFDLLRPDGSAVSVMTIGDRGSFPQFTKYPIAAGERLALIADNLYDHHVFDLRSEKKTSLPKTFPVVWSGKHLLAGQVTSEMTASKPTRSGQWLVLMTTDGKVLDRLWKTPAYTNLGDVSVIR